MSAPADTVARCEPIRRARAPRECFADDPRFDGPCWITDPYRALPTGNTLRCRGCHGTVDPQRKGAPSRQELKDVGIVK
jgi:hypothetical protein